MPTENVDLGSEVVLNVPEESALMKAIFSDWGQVRQTLLGYGIPDDLIKGGFVRDVPIYLQGHPGIFLIRPDDAIVFNERGLALLKGIKKEGISFLSIPSQPSMKVEAGLEGAAHLVMSDRLKRTPVLLAKHRGAIIDYMGASIDVDDWNARCDQVKKAFNGRYPDFWPSASSEAYDIFLRRRMRDVLK